MFNLNTLLPNLIYILPAVIIALSLHEFAHAFVSYKLGDVSQKERGRMSLNPLKHLDPIGTISLIFFGFGWAKPVQVDPYFYRNKKEGMMWTSLAGPFMNFIVAFICVILYSLLLRFAPVWTVTSVIGDYIFQLLIITARINIGLGIFNLIPIPPLDGSKILTGILKEETYFKLM
ncbi:MAG: site-2 protease family protein, partial [Longicatena sp.]